MMKRPSLKRRATRMAVAACIFLSIFIGGFSVYQLSQFYFQGTKTAQSLLLTGVENALITGSRDTQERAVHKLMVAHPSMASLSVRVWRDGEFSSPLFAKGLPNLDWKRLYPKIQNDRPLPGDTFVSKKELEEQGVGLEVMWRRIENRDAVFDILVLRSDQIARSQFTSALIPFLALLLCITIGSILLATKLIRIVISPISAIGQQCEQVDNGDMQPIEMDGKQLPVELDPFVRSLNRMLGRLKSAMVRQRQFVADASHELRTPLATAKSSLQLARSRPRTVPEYQSFLDQTLFELDRMERLMEQLIRLARIDAGKIRLSFDQLDLIGPLQDAIQSVEANPAFRSPEILLFYPGSVYGCGDRALLSRMFQNLIDNAVKYGPDGSAVRVHLEENENLAVVRVVDEGGSIPPEVIPHLFDRFFRADSSRDRATGGSGLGLAIARSVAELHESTLSVTSSPQEGTTITFSMPINDG